MKQNYNKQEQEKKDIKKLKVLLRYRHSRNVIQIYNNKMTCD